MRLRPIAYGDHAALVDLARGAGIGVTTLQPNEERLGRRIEVSVDSFDHRLEKAQANYLFVLEDTVSGHLVGTSGIAAAVGLDEPWYNYRVGTAVYCSREIGVYRQLQTLFLTNDLTGASELCSLFLHPEHRRGGNGGLLSKARFLFLAEFPDLFAHKVIAELRGVSDEQGRSPFWDSLGRHFFRMDFSRADYLSGVGNKSFIAELMPQHPVYTAFLSEAAREVIGEVHTSTRPARAMLESEGFSYQGYVDIFDAGPAVEAPASAIRAVRDSAVCEAAAADKPDGSLFLVSNRRPHEFRVVLAHGAVGEGGRFALTGAHLDALEISAGDSVRVVPLQATR
ncbi:arginine N-succinyltransferase [Niveibacterium sp. 24ML]|uniref:arginine N-succinyltransferase n=1 Tax=Niveibacterium sp. 24ML TaxID=2985512 RepID=UPI00226F2713|nr:arginine N-succinyltransferase [Niveibacterium sp. 24ML]MCX9156454.1 arginine N-succinyltransferase [Niveibacterium sp. 24ML]